MNEDQRLIEAILTQQDGWKVTLDRIGRRGGRTVEAKRVKDGYLVCLATLRQRTRSSYDKKADRWESCPIDGWKKPYLRPCFAPGILG